MHVITPEPSLAGVLHGCPRFASRFKAACTAHNLFPALSSLQHASWQWVLENAQSMRVCLVVHGHGPAPPFASLSVMQEALRVRGAQPVAVMLTHTDTDHRRLYMAVALLSTQSQGIAQLHLCAPGITTQVLRAVGQCMPAVQQLHLDSPANALEGLSCPLPEPPTFPALHKLTLGHITPNSCAEVLSSLAPYLPQLTALSFTDSAACATEVFTQHLLHASFSSSTLHSVAFNCALTDKLITDLLRSAPALVSVSAKSVHLDLQSHLTTFASTQCTWQHLSLESAPPLTSLACLPQPSASKRITVDISGSSYILWSITGKEDCATIKQRLRHVHLTPTITTLRLTSAFALKQCSRHRAMTLAVSACSPLAGPGRWLQLSIIGLTPLLLMAVAAHPEWPLLCIADSTWAPAHAVRAQSHGLCLTLGLLQLTHSLDHAALATLVQSGVHVKTLQAPRLHLSAVLAGATACWDRLELDQASLSSLCKLCTPTVGHQYTVSVRNQLDIIVDSVQASTALVASSTAQRLTEVCRSGCTLSVVASAQLPPNDQPAALSILLQHLSTWPPNHQPRTLQLRGWALTPAFIRQLSQLPPWSCCLEFTGVEWQGTQPAPTYRLLGTCIPRSYCQWVLGWSDRVKEEWLRDVCLSILPADRTADQPLEVHLQLSVGMVQSVAACVEEWGQWPHVRVSGVEAQQPRA